MPKIYKQDCKQCGKHYKGQGMYFCSRKCASLARRGEKKSKEFCTAMSKKMRGNANARGVKHGQEYKNKLAKIVKGQWENPGLRKKKIDGMKAFWQTEKGKKQKVRLSLQTAKMWREKRLKADLLPHGKKHWNYNLDRIDCYRKGVYFSKAQRKRLLKDKCEWCGSTENLQLDHITAIMNGGTNKDENAQTLCRECNNLKRDLIDFRDRKNKRGELRKTLNGDDNKKPKTILSQAKV